MKVSVVQYHNVSNSYIAGDYPTLKDARAAILDAHNQYDCRRSVAAVLNRIGESHGGYCKIVRTSK